MSDTSGDIQVNAADVDSMLAETPHAWAHSPDNPDQWLAVATDRTGFRCELTATIAAGGVEVCGRAAQWDGELAGVSNAALQRFLAAAQQRVGGARYHSGQHHVEAVSQAAIDRPHAELPEQVAAVTAACRLVWREVMALTDAKVAQAYTETIP